MEHQSKNTRAWTGNPTLDGLITQVLEVGKIQQDDADYYRELIVNAIKLARNNPSYADLKLFTRSMRELRVANKIFADYKHIKKLSIFGSARTKPGTPEYVAAHDFAKMMVEAGWMVITGGGDGIMGAAQEGAGAERSFGLNIRLPFEQRANATIEKDPKLINFRYFFTRKVNFVKESKAVVCFPGGFGTMDEAFEALTLIQTGKAPLFPLIFMDAPGGDFWRTFEKYLRDHLLKDGWISSDDFHLFKIMDCQQTAAAEILNFYRNYHSSRYVGDLLVMRLLRPVPEEAFAALQVEFQDICVDGVPVQCHALPEEINEPELTDLTRICVPFNRKNLGRLRKLIDLINEY